MTLYKASTLKPNWRLCGKKHWCPGFRVHEPHSEWNLTIPSPLPEADFWICLQSKPTPARRPGHAVFGNNSHNLQLTGNKHKTRPPRLSLLSFCKSVSEEKGDPTSRKVEKMPDPKNCPTEAQSQTWPCPLWIICSPCTWSKGLIPITAHLYSVTHVGTAAIQEF